jgi:hypothetical protein
MKQIFPIDAFFEAIIERHLYVLAFKAYPAKLDFAIPKY